MVHGRVCDEAFEIRLRQRRERAKHDAGDRQAEENLDVVGDLRRIEWQHDSQETVDAHLQENRGQHHRAAGRGLCVRIRQPRVERPERTLIANPRNVPQNNAAVKQRAVRCSPVRAFTSATNPAIFCASSPLAARERNSTMSNVPVAR